MAAKLGIQPYSVNGFLPDRSRALNSYSYGMPKRSKNHEWRNPDPRDSEFVRRLRAEMARRDLLPSPLAADAGLDLTVIRGLFSHKAKAPNEETMHKICAALGTTLVDFLSDGRTDEEKEIIRLTAALPAPLRQRLLGYGQSLLDEARQASPEVPAEDQ
jgi:transcriptional regulator with XRE-family HTH domain